MPRKRNVNNGILAEQYFLQALCHLNFYQVEVLDYCVPQTIWYPFHNGLEDRAGIDFVLTLEFEGTIYVMPLQLTLERGRRGRRTQKKYERALRGEVALFHLVNSAQLKRDPFGLLRDAAKCDQLALGQLEYLFAGITREFLQRQSPSNQQHILELLTSLPEAESRKVEERRELARKIFEIADSVLAEGMQGRHRYALQCILQHELPEGSGRNRYFTVLQDLKRGNKEERWFATLDALKQWAQTNAVLNKRKT